MLENFVGEGQARSPTKSEWDSAFRGIVRFWEGWFGRKGGGAFERVVGMARFDAAIPQSCDR